MTGHQLKMMRRRLKLSVAEFAALLGYQGSRRNLSLQIRRLEAFGGRLLPIPAQARALSILNRESRKWK